MKYEVHWTEYIRFSAIIEADGYEQAKEEIGAGNFGGEKPLHMPEIDYESIEAHILEEEQPPEHKHGKLVNRHGDRRKGFEE